VELTTWHYRSPLPVGRAAIDRYILAAGHTAANPQQRSATREWDRQTDSKPAAAECSARMGQTDRQTDSKPAAAECSARMGKTDGQQTRSSGEQRANENENENENRLFGMAAMHAGFT